MGKAPPRLETFLVHTATFVEILGVDLEWYANVTKSDAQRKMDKPSYRHHRSETQGHNTVKDSS